MFFNTVVKNPSKDQSYRISFLAQKSITLGPGEIVKIPCEVFTAARSGAQRAMIIKAIESGEIELTYETDMPAVREYKDTKSAAPKAKKEEVEVPVKEEKPVAKAPETKQDEILPETAKEKLKEAEEKTGIVEGTIEDVMPEAITIGADEDENGNPIKPAEPETVTFEDMEEPGAIVSEEKATPQKKPAANKKPAAKKAPAKKAKSKGK